MKKQPSTLRKFFSLRRWQRRFGSARLNETILANDISELKRQLIPPAQSPTQTRGSHHDIQKQIAALEIEFSGQPALVLQHATLIVLIRRESALRENLDRFWYLWELEHDWLLRNLNIRWLVSAADTFADHAEDPIERSLALAVSTLVNTVKAYETEHFLSAAGAVKYGGEQIAHVQDNLVPIFEGLSCYTIGSDDTLRNMVWRIQKNSQGKIVGLILLEILSRLNKLPTPFQRMRNSHTRKKTEWWTE